MARLIYDNKDLEIREECPVRTFVNIHGRSLQIVASVKTGVTHQIWLDTDTEIAHFSHEVVKASEKLTNRDPVQLPDIGKKIGVPEIHLDLDEMLFAASVCVHDKVGKPMVTIIPLGAAPWYILSPWGNGPGIVAFLEDYNGGKVFEIEVVSHPENFRSVDAIVLPTK